LDSHDPFPGLVGLTLTKKRRRSRLHLQPLVGRRLVDPFLLSHREIGLPSLVLVRFDPWGGSRMALRGVWQLQKLVVNYCDWGGSSRGIRYDIVWFLTPVIVVVVSLRHGV